jgi:hypothetical protein
VRFLLVVVLLASCKSEPAPTAPTAPTPPPTDKVEAAAQIDACESAADCELVVQGESCCSTCGRAMTKAAAKRFYERQNEKCKVRDMKCPDLDCPKLEVECVEKRCEAR